MISVIMPTYNERDNIGNLIEEVSRVLEHEDFEIVVVDDNSPDGTWEVVEELGNDSVRVIRRMDERGLATAIKRGITEARGDVIITMDTDFSHPPEVIPELVRVTQISDVVVGSRYMKGGGMEASFGRVIASRLTNLCANIFLGFYVRDFTGGFLAVRNDVFDEVEILAEWGDYGNYCIGFLYACKQRGLRISEIPFTYRFRTKGMTKTAPNQYNFLKWGWRYIVSIIRIRLRGRKDNVSD